ncbi:MAG: hypothetical protein IKI64_06090 [Clostridia bacterium]|nr:hypothetical protein [Clostridia bacterium]
MFKGNSRNTIDAKGRITVPARWRSDLPDKLVVMFGIGDNPEDKFLQFMTPATFEGAYGAIASSSMTDGAFARAKRFILSNAEDITVDKSDRILIPQHLIRYAELSGEVVLCGVGDHIQIWNPERLDRANGGYGVADFSNDAASYAAKYPDRVFGNAN